MNRNWTIPDLNIPLPKPPDALQKRTSLKFQVVLHIWKWTKSGCKFLWRWLKCMHNKMEYFQNLLWSGWVCYWLAYEFNHIMGLTMQLRVDTSSISFCWRRQTSCRRPSGDHPVHTFCKAIPKYIFLHPGECNSIMSPYTEYFLTVLTSSQLCASWRLVHHFLQGAYKCCQWISNWTATEEQCFLWGPLSDSWTATEERCFLCGLCQDVISRTINDSTVQCKELKSWLNSYSENFSSVVVSCCC
jgi:hypothetical protein